MEFAMTVSFKGDGAYDAPLIAIAGNDPQEVLQKVNGTFGMQATSLVDAVVEASVAMRAQHTAAKGLSLPVPAAQEAPAAPNVVQGPWQGGAAPQTPAQGVPQQGQIPQFACPHGPRQRKTGNGRTGPWAGHFCPLPKGTPGQCDPVWEDQ